MDFLALILDAGLGVKREGVIVVVSLYGNSDHKRGGGWPHGRGEGFARDVAEVGGPSPGTGMLSLRFNLTCDQVCAVIQVINKGFYGRGGIQYF